MYAMRLPVTAVAAGRSVARYRACFGSRRSLVRIQSPRLDKQVQEIGQVRAAGGCWWLFGVRGLGCFRRQ